MFRSTAALSVLSLALLGFPFVQGQTKKIAIGDSAPAWSKLPGVDGKDHSLTDLKKEVVVLVFTCNHCPIAGEYEERIIAFTKKNADKVNVVAINVNNFEYDKLPRMKVRAQERGFNFPYLYDESQKIGRAYSASVTPEFFVLNKERKLVYWGAMDDANFGENAKVNYLQPAVDAVLAGKTPEVSETKARGCSIKYEKK